MRKLLLLTYVPLSLMLTGVAHSATGTAIFNGTVLATCAITVATPGILDVNSDGTVLTTSGGGLGTPATAAVVATGGSFRLGVVAPSAFTLAPTGGNVGVSFQSHYTTTGATSLTAIVAGVSSLLNVGITTLAVNLAATKTSAFPVGNYTAQTTITCD